MLGGNKVSSGVALFNVLPITGHREPLGPFPREDRKRPTQQAQDASLSSISLFYENVGLSKENRHEYHRWLLVHDLLNLTYRETLILCNMNISCMLHIGGIIF